MLHGTMQKHDEKLRPIWRVDPRPGSVWIKRNCHDNSVFNFKKKLEQSKNFPRKLPHHKTINGWKWGLHDIVLGYATKNKIGGFRIN